MADDKAKKVGRTQLQRKRSRLGVLERNYAQWKRAHQEARDYVMPWAGQFTTSERNEANRQQRVAATLLDNTATLACRTLAAGLMSGATSPARPWFELTLVDRDGETSHEVRRWLDTVTNKILRTFAASNFYEVMHGIYEELAVFGTAACLVLPHPEKVVWLYPLSAGQYFLAAGPDGKINTLYRRFDMTAAQLVKEFGIENCSDRIKRIMDNPSGDIDQLVTVVHAIEPREDFEPGSGLSTDMPWSSVYWEEGRGHNYSAGDVSEVLRESGFEEFPAIVPRWATSGGDVWGHGPGLEALPDIKGLQHLVRRRAQAVDLKVLPPLALPTSMANQEVDSGPGGRMYSDPTSPGGGIRTAYEVDLQPQQLDQPIAEHQHRIARTFFADLFLMMASADKQMTAEETRERAAEKLVQIGPAVQRQQNEAHDPIVLMTFRALEERGELPDLPEELIGREIAIEYTGPLAQAQKAIVSSSVDRFIVAIGGVAAARPEIVDVVNWEKWAREYADMLGVSPSLLYSEEHVAKIQQARNDAMAAKEQSAMMAEQAGATRDLAQAAGAAPQDVVNQFANVTGA